MLGDAQVGKTSLMVKYVENTFDEDYIETVCLCYGFHNFLAQGSYQTLMLFVSRQFAAWCEFHGKNH